MPKFTYDVPLYVTVTVEAEDTDRATELLKERLNYTHGNFGAWPSGDPILGEVTLFSQPTLIEIDGDAV